jgi:hypothetical protein
MEAPNATDKGRTSSDDYNLFTPIQGFRLEEKTPLVTVQLWDPLQEPCPFVSIRSTRIFEDAQKAETAAQYMDGTITTGSVNS